VEDAEVASKTRGPNIAALKEKSKFGKKYMPNEDILADEMPVVIRNTNAIKPAKDIPADQKRKCNGTHREHSS
jgi:hypothetical protein